MATQVVTPFERHQIELEEETDYHRDVSLYKATGAGWMAVLAYKARYRLAQGWASLKAAGRWILGNLEEAYYWTVTQLKRAGKWLLAAAARAKTAIATSAVAIWSGVTSTAAMLWAKAGASAVFIRAKAIAGAGQLATWLAVPTQFMVGGAAALGAMLWIGGTTVLLVTIAAATVLVVADRVIPVPEGRLGRLKAKVHQAVVTNEPVQLDPKDQQSAIQVLEIDSRVEELSTKLTVAHETDNRVEISELSGRQYVAQSRQVGSTDSINALYRQFYAQHVSVYGESADEMFDWDAVRSGMKLEGKFLESVKVVPSSVFAEQLARTLDAMDVPPAKKAATVKKAATAKKTSAAKKTTTKKVAAKK